MNRIEMNTIAEALVKKRSWIVRGFESLMQSWDKQTSGVKDLPERFKKIIILKKEIIDSCGYVCEERRYFIKIGSPQFDYEYTNGMMGCWENSDHYPEITAELVREIMAGDLPGKIWDHFKKIQSSIDDLNITESRINELIEKLA